MKKFLLTLVAAQTLMLAAPMTAQAHVNLVADPDPSIEATTPTIAFQPDVTVSPVLAPQALNR